MAFTDFQSKTSSENVDNFSLQAMSIDCCVDTTLLPYPCSHFYFDINFGNRLHSKEKRRAWTIFNIICYQIWYQSKSDYMDRAYVDLEKRREKTFTYFLFHQIIGSLHVFHSNTWSLYFVSREDWPFNM